jgi:hypothetical protein
MKTSRIRRTRSPYLGGELRGDFSLCSFFNLELRVQATEGLFLGLTGCKKHCLQTAQETLRGVRTKRSVEMLEIGF